MINIILYFFGMWQSKNQPIQWEFMSDLYKKLKQRLDDNFYSKLTWKQMDTVLNSNTFWIINVAKACITMEFLF